MRSRRSDHRVGRVLKNPLMVVAVGVISVGAGLVASAAQNDTGTVAGSNPGFCDSVPISPACLPVTPLPGNPKLQTPTGITVASDGTIYFTEAGEPIGSIIAQQTIRKVSTAGVVKSIAGDNRQGLADGPGVFNQVPGCYDGSAACNGATFDHPGGLVVDPTTGVIYVADYLNNAIRKIVTTPPVSPSTEPVVAVTTLAGVRAPGSTDGTGTVARFRGPSGIALGSDGNLYVADSANHTIRLVTPAGVVSTFAGNPAVAGAADGAKASATFQAPGDLGFDTAGNLYVLDGINYNIRKIATDGTVSTVVGAGVPGLVDGVKASARLQSPRGLAVVRSSGELYFTENTAGTVRKVATDGSIITVAGSIPGYADGNGYNARFQNPGGIALNNTTGTLYVADSLNHRIRRLETAGAPPAPNTTGVTAVSPFRVLDTRRPSDPAAVNQVWEIPVAGVAGVPVDASGVAVNVTVTQVSGSGFLTVWPCGEPKPSNPITSNLNFETGQTVANAAIAGIGAGGKVCVGTTNTALKLIVDINGYIPKGSPVITFAPKRLMDTRVGQPTSDGLQQGAGFVSAGTQAEVQITSRPNVPASPGAVLLNVTVVEPVGSGFVTVWPCGTAKPNASSLNYTVGQTVANLVVVTPGSNGKVCVEPSQASTKLIVDLGGTGAPGASLPTVTPSRLLDTRPGQPTIDSPKLVEGLVQADGLVEVVIAGRPGVPSGATTAILNLTSVDADGVGWVNAFPCGAELTGADVPSNLNFTAGKTVPNLAVVRIGSGGKVCLRVKNARTHLIADLQSAK
jgi:sugar lactone lactonase YvrE